MVHRRVLCPFFGVALVFAVGGDGEERRANHDHTWCKRHRTAEQQSAWAGAWIVRYLRQGRRRVWKDCRLHQDYGRARRHHRPCERQVEPMTSKPSRVEALRDLVELRGSVSDALVHVSEFKWEVDGDVVILTVRDLSRALDGYSAGLVDETSLCDWAETAQGRDDIVLDAGDRDLLADALFELSTPELFGDMAEVVGLIRERLR